MKKIIFTAWLFLSIFGLEGYALEPDSLAYLLGYQAWVYPQEKVYVATDKDVYTAGDTIRFRAFLVDALKLTGKTDGSKYVYVEIKNPFGETEQKIKVKERNGIFAGIVPLAEEMAEGTYTLAGYTLFMKNQGEDYFFKKPLPVKSQLAKKYKLETQFKGNRLITSLTERFSDKPVAANGVYLNSKKEVLQENIHNRSNFNFSLGSKALKEDVLKVCYDRYEKFVRIPKDTSSLSVTFHPEGGYLIPEVTNIMAFKALGTYGLSKEVSGYVADETGDKVCDIASSHKGMGTFSMTPKTGKTYHAVFNGQRFDLPEPNPKATTLSVNTRNQESITIKIKGEFNPDDVLFADNCGIVTFFSKTTRPEFKVNRKMLGSGLIQLYLVNPKNNIISSRLIFNRNGYVYSDSINSVPEGDYVVTSRKNDSGAVPVQSIVSELMLQSDLKGHIENPDYYFISPDSIKDSHLDNLMLTQGWKRYDIQKAIKGDFDEPQEPMEIGGELTGTVFSRWKRKPLEGAVVNAIAPEINYVGATETDGSGRYALNGVDWPDGTFFILQAFNKEGNKEHNIEIDIDDPVVVRNLPEDLCATVTDSYIFDNGAVWLKELEVKAQKSDEEVRLDMLRALGVKTMTSNEIQEMNITSFDEVVRKIPGLTIMNGTLVNPGAKKLNGSTIVEIWVDGTRWTPYNETVPSNDSSYGAIPHNIFTEFANQYPIHVVKSIQYYRPSAALIISMSAADNGGALVVTTKDGSDLTDWDQDLFLKRVTPLGYQDEAEAYKPHFTYDPIDETTQTSYWYPQVHNLDDFIPLENSTTVIEGITETGLPYMGKIKSKKKK